MAQACVAAYVTLITSDKLTCNSLSKHATRCSTRTFYWLRDACHLGWPYGGPTRAAGAPPTCEPARRPITAIGDGGSALPVPPLGPDPLPGSGLAAAAALDLACAGEPPGVRGGVAPGVPLGVSSSVLAGVAGTAGVPVASTGPSLPPPPSPPLPALPAAPAACDPVHAMSPPQERPLQGLGDGVSAPSSAGRELCPLSRSDRTALAR